MERSERLEKDPVCEMMVDEWSYQVVHRGVGYAFCSEQCRERFSAAPSLYVGWRKSLAPKQKGMEIIKRRRALLGAPLTQAQFARLRDALLSMMGVKDVRFVGRGDQRCLESGTTVNAQIEQLEISYDLLQATAAQLERRMLELDTILSSAWGEKLRRDCIHYLEQCELDDLKIRDGDQLRRNASASQGTQSGFKVGAGTRIAGAISVPAD